MKTLSLDPFHDKEQRPVLLAMAMELDDVGMVEFLESFNFLGKPLPQGGLIRAEA